MADANGRWRATYTPGEWVVLSGPTLLVVMPPAPPKHSRLLNDLWTDVVAAASIVDLTHTLGSYRLDALPHFGVLFWADGQMRSLLRGRVKVRNAETGEELATAEGIQTWAEIGLGDVRRVHIDLASVPGEVLQLPLMTGAVTASAVQVDATDEARIVFPVSEAAFEPADREAVPGAPQPEVAAETGPIAAEPGGVGAVPLAAGAGIGVAAVGIGGATGAASPHIDGSEAGEAGESAPGESAPGEPEVSESAPEESEAGEPEPSEPEVGESEAGEPEPVPGSEEITPATAESEQHAGESGQQAGESDQHAGESEQQVDEPAAESPAAASAGEQPADSADADAPVSDDDLPDTQELEVPDLDLPATEFTDPVGTDFETEYSSPAGGRNPDEMMAVPGEGAPAGAHVVGLGLDDDDDDGEDSSTMLGPPGSVFRVPDHAAPPAGTSAGGPLASGPPAVTAPGGGALPTLGGGPVGAAGIGLAGGAVGGVAAGVAGTPHLPGPPSPFPGSGQVPYPQPQPRPTPQGAPPATGLEQPPPSGQPAMGLEPPPPGGQPAMGLEPPPPSGPPAGLPAEPSPGVPDAAGPAASDSGPLIAGVPSFGAPPPPPPPPREQTEHDGETVFTTGLAATHKVSGAAAPRSDDLVLAAMCSRQHPNPPDARVCARCGAPVDTHSPQLVNRPVLAIVRASTGQTAELDSVVLIGRSPNAQAADENPALMSVPSPSQDISRTHLRLAASHWEIVVTDLHSTNGTMLLRQGEQPVRLHPGEPVSVGIGAVLDLGDGVTILLDQPK